MIETVLSIAGLTYAVISGVRLGKQADKILTECKFARNAIEKLANNTFYIPGTKIVTDVSQSTQSRIFDLTRIRESVEPIQRALGKTLICSDMIAAPALMAGQMK